MENDEKDKSGYKNRSISGSYSIPQGLLQG
jgi:hypothetical protein